MNDGSVLELVRQGFIVAIMVASPVLLVALFAGLAVSVFQAVTQVQEMTLTYVPKLIMAVLVLIAMGSWMLTVLVGFLRMCLDQAARVVA